MMQRWTTGLLLLSTAAAIPSICWAQPQPNPFVNFETPHVHPIDLSPDRGTLAAVNTADNSVEIFAVDTQTGALTHSLSIPVGADPVTARFRTDNELWVVNHISDSISIIDMTQYYVKNTLRLSDSPTDPALTGYVVTGDEPADVVFIETSNGTEMAYVSCSQSNEVIVFDFDMATDSPRHFRTIKLFAEDPRALAASPDGSHVYAAAFESGNATTVLKGGDTPSSAPIGHAVTHPDGPYGGVNPPPNVPNWSTLAAGDPDRFDPPRNFAADFELIPGDPMSVRAPITGHIVQKVWDAGLSEWRWRDDIGEDWTLFFRDPDGAGPEQFTPTPGQGALRVENWDIADYDVAVISTEDLLLAGSSSVPYSNDDNSTDPVLEYEPHLMNMVMTIAVNPLDPDAVTVIGTSANNVRRFEPNLRSDFIDVVGASGVDSSGTASVTTLNPHLFGQLVGQDYDDTADHSVLNAQSLGDPRAVVWTSTGRGFVAGMGSNNVVEFTSNFASRPAGVSVVDLRNPAGSFDPVGPTGLALDDTGGRLYVLNRFAGSISTIDISGTQPTLVTTQEFFDPTPSNINTGRVFLYDTHFSSGYGDSSCASCHVDGRMDRLAWDLGDPSGSTVDFQQHGTPPEDSQNVIGAIGGGQSAYDWHPMKGPLVTQTLQDIVGKEPHHWRGDRDNVIAFQLTFENLQGKVRNPMTPAVPAVSETQMGELEAMLATIHFPPNPYRDQDDNTTQDSISLAGFFAHPNVSPQPSHPNLDPGELRVGDATEGQDLYIDFAAPLGLSCVTCHTLPTGIGTPNTAVSGFTVAFDDNDPADPMNDVPHHAIAVLRDRIGNNFKIPSIRNLYERTGGHTQQTLNRTGIGFGPDGDLVGIEDQLDQFSGTDTEQRLSDALAFLLSSSTTELSTSVYDPMNTPAQPIGPDFDGVKDVHAAVGRQFTVSRFVPSPPATDPLVDFLDGMVTQLGNAPATNHRYVDVVIRGHTATGTGGAMEEVGYLWTGAFNMVSGEPIFDSDDGTTGIELPAIRATLSGGGSLTAMAVPWGSGVRIGLDRDLDDVWNRDELSFNDLSCGDPFDPSKIGRRNSCEVADVNRDGMVTPADVNAWALAAGNGLCECDQNFDGLCTPADVNAWIINANLAGGVGASCP